MKEKTISLLLVLILIPLFNFNQAKLLTEIDNANTNNNPDINGFWNLTGSPIFINGIAKGVAAHNWSWVENQVWFGGGDGSELDPYIIENITINAQNSGSCIEIKNSDSYFIIRNCTVHNSGSQQDGWFLDAGIKLTNVTNGNLVNNTCLYNNGYGIRLKDSNKNEIINNTLRSNKRVGIFSLGSEKNHIISNLIDGFDTNTYGIAFYNEAGLQSNHNLIKRNSIKNYEFGIIVGYHAYNNTIMVNKFKNNTEGIRLVSDHNIISKNIIYHNEIGINFIPDACYNNIITSNKIKDNTQEGILLDGYLTPKPNNNIFYNNSFLGNSVHAIDNGVNNNWDNGSLGNYWDDYSGKDINDDGIGDSPYIDIGGTAGKQDDFPIWWDPPIYSVNSPIQGELFSLSAPEINITINEGINDTIWYTLDNGVTNFTYSTVDTINQAVWDDLDDGDLTLTFYCNDSRGYITINSLIIIKDTTAPKIIINAPTLNQSYSVTAPIFSLSIEEPNLVSTWYTVEGSITQYPFVGLTGIIDQDAWNDASEGSITITFYAQDKAGYIGTESITIIKNILVQPIPGYDFALMIGVISIISIILMKKDKEK